MRSRRLNWCYKVRAAYALCRPPGHPGHDLHGGFCYLNNAAIAARAFPPRANARVAVLDIDYHHGNGTQEIFYRDATVIYFSIHANPDLDSRSSGAVGGRVARSRKAIQPHWPLPRNQRADFLQQLESSGVHHLIDPAFLVLSAGFDFMEGDPVPVGGGFCIGHDGLVASARRIASLQLPTVIVQEGGYNVWKLGGYVATFLQEFAT